MQYEETWNSLKRHRLPEWLDDAKFGIYMHWGVYSVPAFGNEWYPSMMYRLGDIYEHHVETYGDPEQFGYKDFIPMFTAEHFDADEWAQVIKDAGARFPDPWRNIVTDFRCGIVRMILGMQKIWSKNVILWVNLKKPFAIKA